MYFVITFRYVHEKLYQSTPISWSCTLRSLLNNVFSRSVFSREICFNKDKVYARAFMAILLGELQLRRRASWDGTAVALAWWGRRWSRTCYYKSSASTCQKDCQSHVPQDVCNANNNIVWDVFIFDHRFFFLWTFTLQWSQGYQNISIMASHTLWWQWEAFMEFSLSVFSLEDPCWREQF